jgi:hypothetical protein
VNLFSESFDRIYRWKTVFICFVSTGLSALLLMPRDELVQFQPWLIRELVIHSSKLLDFGGDYAQKRSSWRSGRFSRRERLRSVVSNALFDEFDLYRGWMHIAVDKH